MEVEHLRELLNKCGGDIDVFLDKVSNFMKKDSEKVLDLVFKVDKLENELSIYKRRC